MTAPYNYNEKKKCKMCGKDFSVHSHYGNPYKWCEDCRAQKNDEFARMVREYKMERENEVK